MTDPKKDAEKRRAEAQRARRLAASLSQPADQDRLKQYADELERLSGRSRNQPTGSRSTRKNESVRRSAQGCHPAFVPALNQPRISALTLIS